MTTQFDHSVRQRSQRLADLQNDVAERERSLSDARMLLEREFEDAGYDPEPLPGLFDDDADMRSDLADLGGETDYADDDPAFGADSEIAEPGDADDPNFDQPAPPAEDRTEVLVTHGRRGRHYRKFSRRQLMAVGGAAATVLVIILVVVFSGSSASWPASVATIQAESTTACKNPDVASEPGQVNVACSAATRQILWVFALLTSDGNPNFGDAKSGRMGLEPITPAQGGEVAWSLNLHHPYNPSRPVDSLEVAARAINNIIGGATVVSASGSAVVQPGLESSAANCTRYTGSPALTSRPGFPSLCAKPITVPAGQAALVADVYQKWMVGAAPQEAQNAGVLFENAKNPGNPDVQAILRSLRNAQPAG
jgi:hypothetical protein